MFRRDKNSKFKYYLNSYARQLVPKGCTQAALSKKLAAFEHLSSAEQEYILDRVGYYCKLENDTPIGDQAIQLSDFKLSTYQGSKVYFHDTYAYTRYFDDNLRCNMLFGDIIHSPDVPSLTKTRPLTENTNSVILKLDKVRHFFTVKDRIKFEQKSPRAIFRGVIEFKERRINFVEKFHNHPLCDVGEVSDHHRAPHNAEWLCKNMSTQEHLKYRYIVSLEGNDVASNLKWVCSSNSVAIMPRPTCESWFMEGRLVEGEHYIGISNNYDNFLDQLEYYNDHPREAAEISQNQIEYMSQFLDKDREDLITLMVLQRYFKATGQL